MTGLSGIRVLVTGGSAGIGLGIAAGFLDAGAQVMITGRSAEQLRRAAAALADDGHQVETLVSDVSNRDDCFRMADEVASRLGGLDVLCANAGIYPSRGIDDLTESDIQTVFATNVSGTIFCVQACRPALRASGRGRVVVISSITGPYTGYPGFGHYAASKAAQLGFVRTAALELAPDGITVNAILPGTIRTDDAAAADPDAVARLTSNIPVGRVGSPKDIACAATFFASADASFVTGQSLVVDGGQVLPELGSPS
ncbi:MAG: SDR family oxidoreductase [Mycobacterium sp.]